MHQKPKYSKLKTNSKWGKMRAKAFESSKLAKLKKASTLIIYLNNGSN
jgi:gentisate 1,2-dioxygenase